jgi:hypothetical protein
MFIYINQNYVLCILCHIERSRDVIYQFFDSAQDDKIYFEIKWKVF